MFVNTDYYADITNLREKLICDYHMKKRLDDIVTRRGEYSVGPKNNQRNTKSKYESELVTGTGMKTISPNEKQNESVNRNTDDSIDNKLPQIFNVRYVEQNPSNILRKNIMITKNKIKNVRELTIYKDNLNFAGRLMRIRSPLNRDRMFEDWKLHNEYLDNAKKVKNIQGLKKSLEKIKFPSLLGVNEAKKLLNL